MFLPAMSLALFLLVLDGVSASLLSRAEKTPKVPDPDCTVTNPATKEFFDLRPLIRHESDKTDWHINGYDYGHNFTLNICEPMLSDYSDVVDAFDRTNVSGFYLDSDGAKISIGRARRHPFFRGRRLLLEYKDGSKCGDNLYRTTVLSFLCDRELEVTPSLNFLSAPLDCVYIFDIRTSHACPTVPPPQASSSVSPLGVFCIIGGVAFVVYFLASCIYRRQVLHKVGWSQVPHVESFAGIFSFIKDMIVIILANTIGRIPGISGLFTSTKSSGRGRIAIDDENALIDEVDDEY